MESEKLFRIGISQVIAFLAIVAGMLFLWSSGSLVFLLLVGFAFIVMLSARKNEITVKASHVLTLLVAPQLVLWMLLMFRKSSSQLIISASDFYRYGFEDLFWGVTRTARRLTEDGYFERAVEVRGFALIGFAVATVFAYRYLVVMLTVGDSYKLVQRPATADEGWFSRNWAGLLLFLIFFCASVLLDIYAPSCTSRCSNIQTSSFPGMFVLTGGFSITYAAVGLWINLSLIRKAKLNAQQGE